jgi:hypothetical protein
VTCPLHVPWGDWAGATLPAESMTSGVNLDPTDACAAVHAALATLPAYSAPAQVPFHDGLYLFYERGETSAHAPGGRVVRVGNHPRSDGSLHRRLGQHLRGHKNGSVFRKALGGALLRRSQPTSPCLAPGPGMGHWETHGGEPCSECSRLEGQVSALLSTDFTFRCVPIPDRNLRNHLEARLIATIAACPVCTPSALWLGQHAYPAAMRRSGLWNVEFVGGPLMTDEDLKLFQRAAASSDPSSPLPLPGMGAPGAPPLPGAETLLVLPCTKAKTPGGTPGLPGVGALDVVPAPEAEELRAARAAVRPSANVDEARLLPAVERYAPGLLYQGAGRAIADAMERGVYVAIVTGGYGVVLGSEPIGDYEALLDESDWPGQIIGRTLAALADRCRAQRVLAVMTSEPYAHVIRTAPWPASVRVTLVQPGGVRGWDRLRATGRAVADILEGASPATWTDPSTGMQLRIERVQSGSGEPALPPRVPSAPPPAPARATQGPQVSREALDEVRAALERYLAELETSTLATSSRVTYLSVAENFVRWLGGESRLRRRR